MPPIHNKNSKNSAKQKRRILLTISNLKNQKISSIHKATRIYNIPYSTLYNQYHSIQFKQKKHTNNHKLTKFKEKSLIK
jgi:hypothetical protein